MHMHIIKYSWEWIWDLSVFSCGTRHVGLKTRHLCSGIRQNHPDWLKAGNVKLICSALCPHLVGWNQSVNVTNDLRTMYKVRSRHSRTANLHTLNIPEVVCIRLQNSPLWARKQFDEKLNLPWPTCRSQISGLQTDHVTYWPHILRLLIWRDCKPTNPRSTFNQI